MRETAWRIAARHQDWGEALAEYFKTHSRVGGRGERRGATRRQDSRSWAATLPFSRCWRKRLAIDAPTRRARSPLRAMAASRVKVLPDGWLVPLVESMSGDDAAIAHLAVAVARSAPPAPSASIDLQAALLRVARDTNRPPAVRLDALASLSKGLPVVDAGSIRPPARQPRPRPTRRASHGGCLDCREGQAGPRSVDGGRRPGPACRSDRGAAPAASPSTRDPTRPWGSRWSPPWSSRQGAPTCDRTCCVRGWRSTRRPCSQRARHCSLVSRPTR